MNSVLLMLLGKGINSKFIDNKDGMFRSECYYDWICLKTIRKENFNESPEDLLLKSYSEELESRQEMISNEMHVQQGIIAMPTDDKGLNITCEEFLEETGKATIALISFISVPMWLNGSSTNIINKEKPGSLSVNEIVKERITSIIDKSNMRLFYTLDHNDFVLVCNGDRVSLKDYVVTLNKIKQIQLSNASSNFYAIHDITTIYGYKKSVKSNDKISIVLSVCGQNVIPQNAKSDFNIETIGRYDHLSGYHDVSWEGLSGISDCLHNDKVITSRIHIGCECEKVNETSNDSTAFEYGYEFEILAKRFELACSRITEYYQTTGCNLISEDKLCQLYQNDVQYAKSINLMLNEIRVAITITLKRGFSKYNSACFIEAYLYFVKYIESKILNVPQEKWEEYNDKNGGTPSEVLVDVSNAFYKCILTLDSSIMHSERRFIMSDPYQLMLFDVPPKLIAYYTAISHNMVKALSTDGEIDNKYAFMITPDIKKDIYVESITDNHDIGKEINILVIHINERSIYNVTDTTRILAHEIAHHVGLNEDLRRIRAEYYIKCYIAMLVMRCLDYDLFSNDVMIEVKTITSIVDRLFEQVSKSDFFKDSSNYYYMSDLKDKLHRFVISALTDTKESNNINLEILNTFKTFLSKESVFKCAKNSKHFFNTIDREKFEDDSILLDYINNLIFTEAYKNLNEYLANPQNIKEDLDYILHLFKEGYADVQMILLTTASKSQLGDSIDSYRKTFESGNILNSIKEIGRETSVLDAFLDDEESSYENLSALIKKDKILVQAYYRYVHNQVREFFANIEEFKRFKNNDSERKYRKVFDPLKTSLFKNQDDVSNIVSCIDDTIIKYIEDIL